MYTVCVAVETRPNMAQPKAHKANAAGLIEKALVNKIDHPALA